jgi:hypothetical protein
MEIVERVTLTDSLSRVYVKTGMWRDSLWHRQLVPVTGDMLSHCDASFAQKALRFIQIYAVVTDFWPAHYNWYRVACKLANHKPIFNVLSLKRAKRYHGSYWGLKTTNALFAIILRHYILFLVLWYYEYDVNLKLVQIYFM